MRNWVLVFLFVGGSGFAADTISLPSQIVKVINHTGMDGLQKRLHFTGQWECSQRPATLDFLATSDSLSIRKLKGPVNKQGPIHFAWDGPDHFRVRIPEEELAFWLSYECWAVVTATLQVEKDHPVSFQIAVKAETAEKLSKKLSRLFHSSYDDKPEIAIFYLKPTEIEGDGVKSWFERNAHKTPFAFEFYFNGDSYSPWNPYGREEEKSIQSSVAMNGVSPVLFQNAKATLPEVFWVGENFRSASYVHFVGGYIRRIMKWSEDRHDPANAEELYQRIARDVQ